MKFSYNRGYEQGYKDGYEQGLRDGNPFIKIIDSISEIMDRVADTLSDPKFIERLGSAVEKAADNSDEDEEV